MNLDLAQINNLLPLINVGGDKITILLLIVLLFFARGQREISFPPSPAGPAPTPPVVPPGPGPLPVPGPPAPGPGSSPEPPKPVPAPAPAPVPPVVHPPVIHVGPRFNDIITTEFGGAGDEQPSAYGGQVDGNRLGYALPYHFPGTPPLIRVFANSKTVDVPGQDVGPWYPSAKGPADKYWETGTRPRAESDSKTNHAGLDLTNATWEALGLGGVGKAKMSWDFVSVLDKGGPMAPSVPVSPGGPAQQTAPVSGAYPVPTGENHLKVLTNAQCNELFGQFTYTNGSNGDIHIDPAWVAKNIVTVEIPQLAKFKVRNVQCHRLVAPWLVKAFAEIDAAGLMGTILSYDGLWVPRHINHNASLGLSRHSDGAALDINANWNSYGTLGAKRGTTGSTWEIEPIMAANGFACGRWFGYPNLPAHDTDGMHFEFVGAPK